MFPFYRKDTRTKIQNQSETTFEDLRQELNQTLKPKTQKTTPATFSFSKKSDKTKLHSVCGDLDNYQLLRQTRYTYGWSNRQRSTQTTGVISQE